MAKIDARQKLEQIRQKKNKGNKNKTTTGGNVKDLRQLIAKKKKTKTIPDKVASGRITKTRLSTQSVKDLRETNKRLASRRQRSPQIREERPTRRSVVASRPVSTVVNVERPTFNGAQLRNRIQYYVPRHIQQQQQHEPTYIITQAAPQSNLAMDNVPEAQGATVLVTNLNESITKHEVNQLFANIGQLISVDKFNPNAAFVTYRTISAAINAVKEYNNRELDDRPMFVDLMSTPASNVRARLGRPLVIDSQPMQISYDEIRRM